MQEAYIVAGFRTAVTKSKRGGFRFFRPDDLAVQLIQGLMKTLPALPACGGALFSPFFCIALNMALAMS